MIPEKYRVTSWAKTSSKGFPGGPVVKNPPANAGDMDLIPAYGEEWRGAKEPLDESERVEWKVGLKLNIQKTKIMASGSITSWKVDGETVEAVSDFIFGAPKSLQIVTAAMKLEDTYSLEGKLWPS